MTDTLIAALPDTTVSVENVFGFASQLQVPAFSQ
ncbi:MAG: hypothetical protein CFE32_08750, partial [Alphaproteobacteria bacterium PA3]